MMLNMLIKMMKWKSQMKKLDKINIYTYPDGWKKCYEAVEILPEDQREGFFAQFISQMIGM